MNASAPFANLEWQPVTLREALGDHWALVMRHFGQTRQIAALDARLRAAIAAGTFHVDGTAEERVAWEAELKKIDTHPLAHGEPFLFVPGNALELPCIGYAIAGVRAMLARTS